MNKIFFLLFVFIIVNGSTCISQEVSLVKIPHGKVFSFGYAMSKIFPGTQRIVSVYIPEQIDSRKPACVYVQQDGFHPEQKLDLIFDTLIAKQEIPVTVCVFVTPGNLPSTDKNTEGRPNRCLEYDGLGDNYVRFILEEILPKVAQIYNLNLTKNSNDRCIGGASSGGIAAFNAAWEQPDAFSRVYCISGSFVGFRGGNMFPTLIRKTEAKPIRAFLTTGTQDMENCAGNWTLLDMEMDKALKFSGYDYRFKVLEGGHCVGWTESFAEGMRYLWKDWPSLIKAGESAPRVQDIILPDERWQLIKGEYHNICGSASNSKGDVFFADSSDNKIYRITQDGSVKEFLSDAGFCNGLSFGPKDELYTVSMKTGKIMCYDTSGKEKLYAEHIYGQYVLAKPDGGLYVTGEDMLNKPSKVWLIKDGNKTVVDYGLQFGTGIAMTPDYEFLTIGDGHSKWAYSYQIAPNGNLINKERFFSLHVRDSEDNAGTASLCYDREGHLFVATSYGIQVCAWDGPTQVILPLPKGRVTGICFGEAGLNTIFAFCGDKIYKRKVKTHALGAFTPWTKMNRGQL